MKIYLKIPSAIASGFTGLFKKYKQYFLLNSVKFCSCLLEKNELIRKKEKCSLTLKEKKGVKLSAECKSSCSNRNSLAINLFISVNNSLYNNSRVIQIQRVTVFHYCLSKSTPNFGQAALFYSIFLRNRSRQRCHFEAFG